MRSIRVAVVLLLALALPALARARAWKGIMPGVTTQLEVVEKFGEPTAKTKRTGRTILAYYGEQAPEGAKQAQFHLDGQGVVVDIVIFLAAPLDAESIEGTYGKPPKRTFSDETFLKVWEYPQHGVKVFFGKDGNVDALSFGPGTQAQPRPQAKGPAAERDAAAQPAR